MSRVFDRFCVFGFAVVERGDFCYGLVCCVRRIISGGVKCRDNGVSVGGFEFCVWFILFRVSKVQ